MAKKLIDAKNPDNILQWAQDFSDAHAILEAHNIATRVKTATDSTLPGACDFSSTVCLAFSQECYLKALLAISKGEYPREHDLKKLFKALAPDVQARVWAALRKHDPGLNDAGFDKCMTENANAFEIWRYAFEHLDTEFSHFTSFALDLNKALLDVYLNFYPENPPTGFGQP
ncbi:MAG TPA: hypothetical protein VM639_00875 [Dongiaceae bacterium]|nr:hypothetical protein [Dongiaceae bacterium]